MTRISVAICILTMYIVYCLQDINSCTTNTVICCNASHESPMCARLPWWSANLVKHHCPRNHFHLSGMSDCHPWLNCSDLQDVSVKELVGLGAVKAVYLAHWANVNIAYSVLNSPHYVSDFQYGLNMLRIFNPSPFVVQLVGYCQEKNVILTEYHKHGNAVNIMDNIAFKDKNLLQNRLGLCLNYAKLLKFLHNSPAGIRVFCDSNDLEKLLSQLLVTDKLILVLNDLDALPEVNKENNVTVKCGHAQITGSFVAPEQLWVSQEPYDDKQMTGYDEKTDIWKSAAVCNHFLGDAIKTNIVVQYYLFSLHENCMDKNPQNRPSATRLVKEYLKIIEMLTN